MQILYHDKHIAVCQKEPGTLSEQGEGSVPEKLSAELHIPPELVYTVHRLDRTTGGLMVYALNKKAAAHLSEEIREGRFHKEYLALAEGQMEPETGEMVDWLYFDRVKNRSYPVKKRAGAKEAKLTYEVEQILSSPSPEVDVLSLCRVQLETGRTHQIRVQFASRMHPLAGDRKYGAKVAEKHVHPLWSVKLGFVHPGGDEMVFEMDTPTVMAKMGL